MYKKAGLETIQIGSSALIDIETFLDSTVNDKWWRWKNNRATKAGYIYQVSMPPHSAMFIDQLKTVSDAWLTKDGRVERGFALGYFDESYLQKCDIHYLMDESKKVLAFTNQLPQFISTNTVTVDLLRHLPETSDAMPYLLYKAIDKIVENNHEYKYFDLGFVPFAKVNEPILAIAKVLSAGRFSARGLEQFKDKFDPKWQPNYMAYDGDIADLALIALNLEKAMDQEV
jgi:phosphatidylglycerol lysyltransferase